MNLPLLPALRRLLPLLVLLLALPGVRGQNAAPPGTMSFQGYLTDGNGNPLGATNAGPKSYTVVFRIWDLASGGVTNSPDELDAEQQTVTVNNGYFSILLGQGSAYSPEPFVGTNLASLFTGPKAATRYVEMMVVGIGASQANITLAPRLQLVASPYAYLAANAVNAGTAGQLLNTNNNAPAVTVSPGNGYVGIGTTTPGNQLEVGGSATIDSSLTVGGNISDSGTLTAGGSIAGSYFSAYASTTSHAGQGAYLEWNKDNGGGGTYLVNQKGTGGGGFHFDEATTANSLTERMTITGSGYLGIGTTTPAQMLEVNGGEQLDGSLFMNNMQTMNAKNASGVTETFLWPRWSDNCTYLNYGSGGFHIRNNAATEALWIGNNGYVGIGTTGPGVALDVSAAGGIRARGGAPGSGGVNNNGYAFSNGGDNDSGMFSDGDGVVEFYSNSSEKMRLNGTGLGINTTTPGYPLDVEGSITLNDNTTSSGGSGHGMTQFFPSTTTYGGGVNTPNISSMSWPVSIYTGGWVAAYGMVSFSDARIKNIIGRSDNAADLAKLMKVEVTDFNYIDKVSQSSRPQKKLIAQQVEKVFPQAVTQGVGVIPDIYKPAKIKDGWVQLATDLKTGERVRLVDTRQTAVYDVLAVTNGAFQVKLATNVPEVFVYGREVRDLRTVDYEGIAMLNVSATQELAHRLEQLEARQNQVAELERKAAQVDDLTREVAELKKLVAQLAAPKGAKLADRSAADPAATMASSAR